MCGVDLEVDRCDPGFALTVVVFGGYESMWPFFRLHLNGGSQKVCFA